MKVTFMTQNKGETVIDSTFIHIRSSHKDPRHHDHDLLSVNNNIQHFYVYSRQVYSNIHELWLQYPFVEAKWPSG